MSAAVKGTRRHTSGIVQVVTYLGRYHYSAFYNLDLVLLTKTLTSFYNCITPINMATSPQSSGYDVAASLPTYEDIAAMFENDDSTERFFKLRKCDSMPCV